MDQFEGKRSLRFYRKHICPSVEIIERNHRRINILTRGKEKRRRRRKKKAATREAFSFSLSLISVFLSLEELASRGSESRRLSLTHCNVSTFLSGGAVPRRGFIKQFLAAADPKNPPWKMAATDPIDQFSSRELALANFLKLADSFDSLRSRKVGGDSVVMQSCGSLTVSRFGVTTD